MAGEKSVDLLMKFKMHSGRHIEAESQDFMGLENFKQDPLLKGFKAGEVFEVSSFTFGTGIELDEDEEDEGTKAANATANAALAQVNDLRRQLAATEQGRGRNARGAAPSRIRQRTKAMPWESGKQYPVQVQPVTFERLIDKASSRLLQACFDSTSFASATLVKRRSTGGIAAGHGYLRMDFGGVLITELEWSNDDYVKETCTFHCRSVLVQYRPVLPNGELGAVVPGDWSMPKAVVPDGKS